MEPEKLADLIRDELQNGISLLSRLGHLSSDWFEKHSLSSPKSKLHSRILGILARMKMEDGWIIDIERALKPSSKGRNQFTPDIIAWDHENKIAFVIEYSSIDTSGHYIIRKDIENNYINYVMNPSNDGLPLLWTIISTLPNKSIDDHPSWDFIRDGFFYERKDRKELWKILLNSPINFWEERYKKAIEGAFKKTKGVCPICWMNIDRGEVSVKLLKV
ncbi:MAG: hypothetical protein ACOZF2_15030 [Thermodesulfobacteriota bacterium]